MNQDKTSFTDQDFEKMEDEILALKITVHALISAVSKCDDRAREELTRQLSFEANNLEKNHPVFPDTVKTLDFFFNQLIDIYKTKQSKSVD